MKTEKYSQDVLNDLLDNWCIEYTNSKYNKSRYIDTKPFNLEILKFVYNRNMPDIDSPHFLCRCDCGNLALKKCNHVINGTVRTCGMCSKSKYKDDIWIGLKINNYEVIDTVRYEEQMYFKVKCLNCNSIHNISASGLVSGVFSKCKNCYNTCNYIDSTEVEITDSHKYIKETDEYIVNTISINDEQFYITQCKRCSLQRIRKCTDVESLNFGKFKECTCKRRKTSNSDKEHEKRQRKFEYYRSYKALEGTKQGKLSIKQFNIGEKLDDSTFTCDCGCGKKDIKLGAYQIYNGRTTQCGECLGAPNEKYGDPEYIGKTFRYLKVIGIEKRDSKTIWKCECLNCNSICEFPAGNIVCGNNSSCGCMTSVYEKFVNDILEKHKVSFVRQCTFDNLIGIGGGKLRFDFMCKSKDNKAIAIEYDGVQHFIPIKFSDKKSIEDAEEAFEVTTYHDKLKNEFCINNNIKLYRLNGNIDEQDILDIINKENL